MDGTPSEDAGDRRRDLPGFRRGLRGLLDSAREVYDQAASDNIFFLASGLTFSLLLAAVPFLVLLLAVAGLVLGPQLAAPRGVMLDWIQSLLPVSDEIAAQVRASMLDLVESSRSVGWIGLLLFAWFSTRLFGALRTVLDSVFDLREGPGILRAKLMDLRLVGIATLLLTANVGITTTFLAASREVLGHLPLPQASTVRVFGYATAFGAIFLMFLLIYKFVPATRLEWRTAAVAALVASIGFEILKAAFGWYLSDVADFSRVFFAFATLVIVVVSFYYASVLFVLGAEVSKVHAMRRAMRRQREAFGGA